MDIFSDQSRTNNKETLQMAVTNNDANKSYKLLNLIFSHKIEKKELDM